MKFLRRVRLPHVSLKPRSLTASLLELSGVAGIVYGVGLVSTPAAFIVGGLLAVAAALAVERGGTL